jgi:HD-like signal output (HDOD) protein
MHNQKVKDTIIDKVSSIPTIPHVIRRLIPLLQNENVIIEQLMQVLSYDMAISTRLLKVANSAYYGLMKKISTVRDAITILGLRQVRSLALGISVIETMKDISSKTSLNIKDLWMHSIGSALAAQLLAQTVSDIDSETAFTVALLHDMGKIPLNGLFSSDYTNVMEITTDSSLMFTAEETVFGFDHGEVAGWLCECWKFPKILMIPIQYHHYLNRVDETWKRMTAVVSCSDYLSRRSGIGCRCNSKSDYVPEEAFTILNLTEETINSVLTELSHKGKDATAFFNATQ